MGKTYEPYKNLNWMKQEMRRVDRVPTMVTHTITIEDIRKSLTGVAN